MSMLPNSQEARDVAYQLHAYTNARAHQQAGPLVIERGEGPYVFDASGKRYFEAMSGLWSVGLGFSEKRLVEAAHKQMQALPFYHTFSSKSHGPSIDLAEKLVALAPVPMSKVFFTNSGSEANDTVLKLIAYRSNCARPAAAQEDHQPHPRLSRRHHCLGQPHRPAEQSPLLRPAAAAHPAHRLAAFLQGRRARARARKPSRRGAPRSWTNVDPEGRAGHHRGLLR